MARKKMKEPRVLTVANKRVAGMKSIDPSLDLGDGYTVAGYEQKAKGLDSTIELYNSALAKVDALLDQIKAQEKDLGEWNTNMLAAVGKKFGLSSPQYEQAGGKPRNERKRPERKKKTPPPSK